MIYRSRWNRFIKDTGNVKIENGSRVFGGWRTLNSFSNKAKQRGFLSHI